MPIPDKCQKACDLVVFLYRGRCADALPCIADVAERTRREEGARACRDCGLGDNFHLQVVEKVE